VGGGIINPITGRRLVKSWRYDTLFPLAQGRYRMIEGDLGISLWHGMRVRRFFADERERAIGSDAQRRADMAALIESADEHGWWVRGAARVNIRALLAASRARWIAAGKLRCGRVEIERELDRHCIVIDCRGVESTTAEEFQAVPWEYSKGQVLVLEVAGLDPDVVLNRRWWIVPTGPAAAVAGATNEPGVQDVAATDIARERIAAAVTKILGPDVLFRIVGQRVGIRVNLPDKRPIAGWSPVNARLGLLNALGAKGALWAPFLAQQWVDHLKAGAAFDPEVAVRRFTSASPANRGRPG
jgi:hypothetical protein